MQLVSALGYDQAVVVAHDWGGAICWNLAIQFPQLVRQLIIVNSPHPYLFARALATDPAQQAASAYMNWLRKPGSEKALAANDFAPAALVEPLTPKEQKVLQLLAEGYSNVAMAERLFVSETTVRTHLRNISAKLHASNRTQAVAIARQLGLL